MVGNGGGVMHPTDFEEVPEDGDELSDNRATVRRYIEAAWNHGDMSAVDALVSEQHRRHRGNMVSQGRDSIKQLINSARGSFPDLVIDIEDLIAENDKVVARYTLTGTDNGGVQGASPTGIRVRVAGIVVFRLAGGMIAESWPSPDALGLLEQLGQVQPQGQPQPGP